MAAKTIQDKPKNEIQAIIYDLILMGFFTGMRLSEMLFMKKVYIQDHVIIYPIETTKYRKRVMGNYKKVRMIYLSNNSLSIINKYYNTSKDEYIFPLKWRNPNIVFYVVKKIRKITGIADFSFH